MMIEQFLNYLQYERNRSELTVKSYGDDLRAFEAYFKQLDNHEISWESVDSDIIRDWMESMMDKGNSVSSINRRLSALRSLYRFALSRNLVAKDPAHSVSGPKKSKPLPQYLRESQMNQLLDDIQWDLSTFNNKQRIIPVGDELVRVLAEYRQFRDTHVVRKCEAFFVTEKGERMTRAQVRNEVKKHLSKVTSMKKRTPHVLRHTFATAMLNNDAGIESVKKLLGHESLSTTEIYTHTTFEQLKKVYSNAHPRA